ncbi:carboxypeptidase regulatory-like domain-containing protein [Candidatus Berkelbacteria bacterium]|nr:carboxypeptidase regulatory-like domain-containing protein [Candidatus Berkelbacteria bacterium]
MNFPASFNQKLAEFPFRPTHSKALRIRTALLGLAYLVLGFLGVLPWPVIFLLALFQLPLVYLFHWLQKKWTILDPALTLITFGLDGLVATYIIHNSGLLGLIFLAITIFQVVIIGVLDYVQIAFLVAFLDSLFLLGLVLLEQGGLAPPGSFFFQLGTHPFSLWMVVALIHFIAALAPGLIGEEQKIKSKKHWGVVLDKTTKKPLPLSIVRVFDGEGKLKQTAITDDNGRYNLLVKPGKYRLEVIKEGFQTKLLKEKEVLGPLGAYIGEDVALEPR